MPSKHRLFYVTLAVFMTVLVFVGFWPTYFGLLLGEGGFGRHWVFHLHAVVFMGWMAVFLGQTVLVSRRRTRVHMRIGTGGFLWGLAVFVMGVVVSLVLVREGFDAGVLETWPEALWQTSAPLVDITQFAVLCSLGWVHRRRLDFHKRYMTLATVAILPAATARMAYLLGPWSFEMMFVVLWALLLGHDLRTQGKLHKASLVGLVVLLPRLVLNISYKFVS